MKYTEKQTTEIKDGFRVVWFIPIEFLLTATMVGLAPKLGLGPSILIVVIPACFILAKVSNIQNKLSAPYVEAHWSTINQLTPEQKLAFWSSEIYGHDFTKPYWYEDIVMKETREILNPLTPIKKFAYSISKIKLPKISFHLFIRAATANWVK